MGSCSTSASASTAAQTLASTEQGLVFTDAAAAKVKALLEEEGNSALNLRVFITGGGCSGFQYGFTFDETIQEDDYVVEKKVGGSFCSINTQTEADCASTTGATTASNAPTTAVTVIRLLVDPMSFSYLKNAEIDYREDVNGEQFVIRNPNAKTTCGCGSSFSIEDATAEE